MQPRLNTTATFDGTAVTGTFTYNPATGTVLDAGANQALSVSFTPNDTADFNSATGNAVINVAKGTQTLIFAKPAAITYGTPLAASTPEITGQLVASLAVRRVSPTAWHRPAR